jgi:hypothetical protein
MHPTREPAAYAEAVRLVIAALVGVGWITLDDSLIQSIVTAVGALASIVLTVVVRSKVTPLPPAAGRTTDLL